MERNAQSHQPPRHALPAPRSDNPAPPDSFHPQELCYPSNLLTLARLLLIPPIVRCLYQQDKRYRALVYIAIAMLTDVLDGPLARSRNEVSTLGKFLDPLADKLLLNTTAVALSHTGRMPWWMTALILARDIGILMTGLLVYRRRDHITPSLTIGKITTVALTVALLLYIADGERSGKPAMYLWLAVGIVSVLQYSWRFSRLMGTEG
jgi:CDP-diacylglycerol---glycerol-3-phosphate 3-phosphatidyltransferase